MDDVDLTALVERVGRLEAERAIADTLYAYGRGLDYGERDVFLNCFTADADYRVDMRIGGESTLHYRGQAELAEYYESHTHAPDAWHKHVTTNPSISVDGDKATTVSYFLRVDACAEEAGLAYVLASGRYLDEFVLGDDDVWRIRSRRCEVENL